MNRGSHEDRPIDTLGVHASMRPRFMNRGSPVTVTQRKLLALRFNEAPIHESGK